MKSKFREYGESSKDSQLVGGRDRLEFKASIPESDLFSCQTSNILGPFSLRMELNAS